MFPHGLGADPGQDVRANPKHPAVRKEPRLEHPGAAEHQDGEGALPRHLHLSGRGQPGGAASADWGALRKGDADMWMWDAGLCTVQVPGIRVYGMLCLRGGGRRRKARLLGPTSQPQFPPVPDTLLRAVR